MLRAEGTALGDDPTTETETDEFLQTLFDCLCSQITSILIENLLTAPETGLYKAPNYTLQTLHYTNKGISRQGVSETPDGKTGGSVTLPRPLELELAHPRTELEQFFLLVSKKIIVLLPYF